MTDTGTHEALDKGGLTHQLLLLLLLKVLGRIRSDVVGVRAC